MTYKDARRIILAELTARGWQCSAGLKVDHARSPEGDVALFFRTQAIWCAPLAGNQSASSAYKGAHSLFSCSKEIAQAGQMGFDCLVRTAHARASAETSPLAEESLADPRRSPT
jgi:hypothetical protein